MLKMHIRVNNKGQITLGTLETEARDLLNPGVQDLLGDKEEEWDDVY